ncbi:helix-turn-helix domain-containing protein [Microbacterium sp. ZXX196]|uniref:helix-turn-helix domain-containing protein n=1 Tax=Microbacterium sp. ZXX196 TaxID=2609291 RepID=UPI0018ACCC54|nr:AraC family transcriptional regulator [Microbacterium sp. ZXX196]
MPHAMPSSPLSPSVAPAGVGTHATVSLAGRAGLELLSAGLTVSAAPPEAFRARLVSARIGHVTFQELTANAWTMVRSATDVREAPSDVVFLTRVARGALHIESGDGEAHTLTVGQSAVLPLSRAFRNHTIGPSRIVSLALPVGALRMTPDQVAHRAFRALPASPLDAALAGMTDGLATAAPTDGSPETALVARALTDLVHARILSPGPVVNEGPPLADVRTRVRDLIAAEYTDPDLTVAHIARRMNISRTHLHKLFEGEELSLAQTIRLRRVEAAGRDLIITEDGFEEIARRVGFGSPDAAYRAFRAQKGMSPAAYRRRGLGF